MTHPELANKILQVILTHQGTSGSDGGTTSSSLSGFLNEDQALVESVLKDLRMNHPEWFVKDKPGNRHDAYYITIEASHLDEVNRFLQEGGFTIR